MGEKNVYKRPSWDEYFLRLSDFVGARGTCDRGRAGTVIVRDKRVLATGYVGSPPGMDHCDDEGHLFKDTIHSDGTISRHCVRTMHSEMNAIAQAAKFGINISESTVYCKMEPCFWCAKMIVSVGIRRVVCRKKYHGAADTRALFSKAGVILEVLSDEVEEYPDQSVEK